MAITNCFSELYSRVQADFVDRLPGCHKSRGEGLSLIANVVLNTLDFVPRVIHQTLSLIQRILGARAKHTGHGPLHAARVRWTSSLFPDSLIMAQLALIMRGVLQAGCLLLRQVSRAAFGGSEGRQGGTTEGSCPGTWSRCPDGGAERSLTAHADCSRFECAIHHGHVLQRSGRDFHGRRPFLRRRAGTRCSHRSPGERPHQDVAAEPF